MTKTVLVTGCNRGIGLSLCKLYSAQGYRVIATCREASAELKALDVRIIEGIDLSHPESIQELSAAVENVTIDILINNAGILRDERLGNLDFSSIATQFDVNTLGPLRVTEALLPNLPPEGKIAFITSRMGSIEDNTSGGRYGYRMSKCALNAAAVSISHDLRHRNIAVAILHPGLVGTDMIGGYGNVTPDEAAQQLYERIQALTADNSGTFWHANGNELPW